MRSGWVSAASTVHLSPCGRGRIALAIRVRGLSTRMKIPHVRRETPHPARTASAPPSPARGEGKGVRRTADSINTHPALIIEVDGGQHNESTSDAIRDRR